MKLVKPSFSLADPPVLLASSLNKRAGVSLNSMLRPPVVPVPTRSTTARKAIAPRSNAGIRINLREDAEMTNWLNRLKKVFGGKGQEPALPKVARWQASQFDVMSTLIRAGAIGSGFVVYRVDTGKKSKAVANPFVKVVSRVGKDRMLIQVYGYQLEIPAEQLKLN